MAKEEEEIFLWMDIESQALSNLQPLFLMENFQFKYYQRGELEF